MKLSKRAAGISPSKTLSVDARVAEMRKAGVDVIGFGAGEPDFDTPDYIKAAAIAAINHGYTKYTPASGAADLKEAICEKLRKENGLDYEPSQVIVSCGAKHSVYNVIQALCDEGDEVIIPSPYWVSYPEMVRIVGAVPVFVETSPENGFALKAGAIEDAITPRTKLIILNSPCNPTGAVQDVETLEEISRVAVKHGIYVLSDEIYEDFVYDDARHVSIASLGEDIKALTIVVNGVSKAHAMTGWRIGYACGDKAIIKAMSNLQSHQTSNPPSISQKAAVAALLGPGEPRRNMVKEFKQRRDYMVDRLNKLPGIRCVLPRGAFYAFPDISGLYGKKLGGTIIKDSETFAEALLSEARVAVVPGSAFGANDFVRFSYATSRERIATGLDRIEAALERLMLS
ncbi:MAG TPA: pyridoxal phosphate-dependent aminotransferase [Firmicutes bacterium]|nr:pyridoxal phosphate-dependent aminotransferase [Bacillota bacterium]